MAFHYGTGLVMSIGIGLILINNTWRLLRGRTDDAELIQLLRAGHQGVNLTTEDWDRLITWIDLNTPAQGRRSEPCGA